MANENQAWQRYYYPGTDTLRNKANIHDHTELRTAEYRKASSAALALRQGTRSLDGETVEERLCSAHRQLFEEIYDWAGDLRDVNISKGGNHFGDHNSMGMYLRQANGAVQRFDWERASYDEKLTQLAALHTDLNFAHPFREGNGRATKVFMSDLAQQHGIELSFADVDSDVWNEASRQTFLDPHGLRQDIQPMLDVYQQIATPLETDPEPTSTAPPAYDVMVSPHAQRESGQPATNLNSSAPDLTITTGQAEEPGLGD